MSKISELVQFAKQDTTNIDLDVKLGIVPNYQAQEINRITGYKVNEAKKRITVYGIRHAIKEHGDNKEQMKRGQLGLLDTDFELVPSILLLPDLIEKGNDKRGKKSIMFIKTIGIKKYHIAMSIHSTREGVEIIFNTMFAKKKADVN